MALTWDQIGDLNLTAGQKTKLAQAEAIGRLLIANGTANTSAVTPTQAKAIRSFCSDMKDKIEPALVTAKYIIKKARDDAAQAADDAIPSGSL